MASPAVPASTQELSREQLLALLAERDAALAEREAALEARDAALAAQAAALAESNTALAARDAELAAHRALLSEEAATSQRLLRLLELERRHPKLDDVVCYLALAGYVREAEAASGVNSDVWRRDEQLRWVTVKARHGKWRRTRLHWACERGLLPRVIELLEWKSGIEAADVEGRTPLHLASEGGHLEVVRELVRRGAKIGAEGNNGSTPLHRASFFGHAEVARLLLDSGADIEAKCNMGFTPLHDASQEGKLEVVQLLVARGAVVDARNASSATPLMIASFWSHAPVVRALLAAGADVRARDGRNYTALHWANYNGRTEAMCELLKCHDAELDAQNDFGYTPLMYACVNGCLMAATALIDAGADVNLLSHAGESALCLTERIVAELTPAAAQRDEHRAVVALLRVHGAV